MSSSKSLKRVKQALRWLPDHVYLQLYYFAKFRRFGNFRNPRTFNEKLQWLKLNHRRPEDAIFVDKYNVKPLIEQAIGAEYVIPTIAVYDSADQIDFDALPTSFVLKCTHDSEGVEIIKNKSAVDLERVRRNLSEALKRNFFYVGREPHYRSLRPRIIAEPYLEDDEHRELLDYKFLCFDGEVKALFIASGRSSGQTKFDYFDASFRPLDVRQSYPVSIEKPKKPACFEDMLSIARRLSAGRPHVRVDLYQVNGRVYFGELTFYHFSGFAPFIPDEWDRVWGDWLRLPVTSSVHRPLG